MSGPDSLLRHVASELRAAAYLQTEGPFWGPGRDASSTSLATGHVTASPAFPFDVLSGTVALAKTTVLVVDLDAVVHDCVRVMRWCATTLTTRTTSTMTVHIPTLQQLLCCFLDMVRGIIAKQAVTVEFVLGNCSDALADLDDISVVAEATDSAVDAAGCDIESAREALTKALPDASGRSVRAASTWLDVYQTLVLYLMSGAGGARKSISLYTTGESGWAGAALRLRLLRSTQSALNLQTFPLLWSTDARAFFAAADTDVVVSTWLLYSSRRVGQLCGQTLPVSLLFPDDTPTSDAARCQKPLLDMCATSGEVPERLLIRHAPCAARRLGLASAAYLPSLYALLFLHDFRRVTAPSAGGKVGLSPAPPSRGAGWSAAQVWVPPHRTAASLSDAAMALVNRHGGILHRDLVEAWCASTEESRGDSPRSAASALDPLLWAAQNAVSTLTARDLSPDRHLCAVWEGEQWRNHGPPSLAISLGTSTLAYLASMPNPTSCDSAEAAIAAPPTVSHSSAAAVQLRHLRRQILCLSRHVFPGGEVNVEGGVTAVLGRSAYLGCILAEPLGDTTAPGWPTTFLTRAALDDVREGLRPAAQLTLAALSLLWRRGLWEEEACLRFLGFFLVHCEAEAVTAVHGATPVTEKAHERGTGAVLCGVCLCEVVAWWDALACVTLLQSLSTRVAHGPPQHTLGGAAHEFLCEPASVFTGCLPGASYGTADRVSFLGFLKSRGYLLSCSHEKKEWASPPCLDGEMTPQHRASGTAEGSLSIMTSARLEQLRRVLPSPAVSDEVIKGHHIFEHLHATLPQP